MQKLNMYSMQAFKFVKNVYLVLPVNCSWDHIGETSFEVTLKRGWSQEYQSLTSLVEEAIEHCNPGGQGSVGDEEFDEDRARYLLRTRGVVDVNDFLSEEDGYSDEVGGNVKIRHRRITLPNAVRCIARTTRNVLNETM